MCDKIEKFKDPQLHDGLVLYYHPYNFYSQKILLLLYEKGIEFVPYIVDLSNGEQYSSWFLNLNPKGDVPVLQDGCFVIPESANIIIYLEENYEKRKDQAAKTKRTGNELRKAAFYEKTFSRIPIGAISLGSFIHDDLNLNPKPPFIGPIKKACLENNDKVNAILKASADQVKFLSSALAKKANYQDRRRQIVYNREEFQKLLDSVQSVLDFVDSELSKQKNDNSWLCSTEFSMVDITFGLLLYRLYNLGFENYFWANGKLPHVANYFQNFRNRESFKKSLPSSFSILKDIWNKAPSNYKIGAGVLGMAMFAASALVHKTV